MHQAMSWRAAIGPSPGLPPTHPYGPDREKRSRSTESSFWTHGPRTIPACCMRCSSLARSPRRQGTGFWNCLSSNTCCRRENTKDFNDFNNWARDKSYPTLPSSNIEELCDESPYLSRELDKGGASYRLTPQTWPAGRGKAGLYASAGGVPECRPSNDHQALRYSKSDG